MSIFRVCIYSPTSEPIHLDLQDGILASGAIRQALQLSRQSGGSRTQGQTEDKDGNTEGWRLRARRYAEEGRWWSEDDIKAYSDRKHDHER
jgi:hypothetical protein